MTDPGTHNEGIVIHAGVATFFGREQRRASELSGIDCAIAGVPWDEGSAGRLGANYGPRAFRDASSWTDGYDAQHDFDVWQSLPTADVGDVIVVPSNSARTMEKVADHVRAMRELGVLPICIGGNHSITIGAARGAAATIGTMGYLSIDAHLDMAESWVGEPYFNGCPTFRATELQNVDPKNVVVFGVRGTLNPRASVELAKELGVSWYGMNQIGSAGIEPMLSEAIEIATHGVDGLYVTFDLDAVDPSVAPGVGAPEPGGFTSREALQIARMLGAAQPIAFDLVELAPVYDPSTNSARVASAITHSLLSALAQGRRNGI
jgi:agmatinase